MKRTVFLLLAAAMLLTSLSACAQKPADSTGQTTAATQATTAATGAPALPPEETQAESPVLPEVLPELSEVMPDNRNLILGHGQDWIELYYPGDSALSLAGFSLTDGSAVLPLDDYSIPGSGYLVIPLADDGPFCLSEVGGCVSLLFSGQTVSALSYTAAENGKSFDSLGACAFPTPGYANTEAGYLEYCAAQPVPELCITEVMPVNTDTYAVYYRQYYDWVEVTNTSTAPIRLADYYLTDRWESTSRYQFPDAVLEAGESYLVLCSGDSSLGESHAPFGLSQGDTVYLARHGVFVDALPIPLDLKPDESYGRSDGAAVYLDEPTPGQSNASGSVSGVAMPTADIAPGMYTVAQSITLSGQGTIYYTTDGSRPTTGSSVYQGPVAVDGLTTLRAICYQDGRSSAIANFAYAIGTDHDLPVLLISIPDRSMWGYEGILSDVEASYEYEAVMTLFEDGEAKFTVPFGLCLHGNDSRYGRKKNYQLRFRAEYGVGKLNYPLFEDRDIDSYNSLLLKGGSEDWGVSMIRDELSTSLANGTSALYTQAMKPVVLYMAGEYWGVHHLRERFSADYVASHLGVSPESVDILFSTDGYAQVGSAEDFTALKNYTVTHDMSTPENWAYLCSQIDVTSLIDWYVFRTYFEDVDTANIRRFRSSEGDGKWHWMFFDLDWSFYSRDDEPVTGIVDMYGGDKKLIYAVLASEAGRDAFLKRYAYLLENVLNEGYINRRIDEMLSAIASEMPRDRERWNRTLSGWEYQIDQLRDFTEDRHEIILGDLQRYFSLSDAEMEAYFGKLLR